MRAIALLTLFIAACATVDTPSELERLDERWDFSDPAATEARFLELLPLAEASASRDLHAQLLSQIARTHSLRGEFDSAHAWLDRAEPLLDATTTTARIRVLLERGRTHNSAGERERAVPLFEQAWQRARASADDALALDAVHMLAIADEPERALAWHQLGISYAEASSDERARRWLGPLLNNVGFAHLGAERFDEALDAFERALVVRLERGDVDPIRVARWCVAHAKRRLGRVEEALTAQLELLSGYGDAGDPSGYTYEEIGECLLALGRAEEARAYFADAHARLSQDAWFVANEAERLARIERLASAP